MFFYESFEKAISNLPDTLDQLKMYKAITNRSLYGKEPELSGILSSMYELIKPQIEANERKYINGIKGGAPKENKNASKKKQPENNLKTTKNNLMIM